MKLTLRTDPDKFLRQQTIEVTDFQETAKHIDAMLDFIRTLSWGTPVGLASNQVGLSGRFFLMMTEWDKNTKAISYKAIINPKILNKSKNVNIEQEGCYSLSPDELYFVERPQTVWVEYQDLTGQVHQEKLNGLKARIFLHEFDHLEGRLCYQQ